MSLINIPSPPLPLPVFFWREGILILKSPSDFQKFGKSMLINVFSGNVNIKYEIALEI